jgi:uncharacterized protein (TIGR02246 family)
MITRTLVSGLCALAALAVAGPTEEVPSGHTRMIPAGADPRLLSAITKANTDFEVAMTRADTASIAAPYTPDAVFVSPDGTATKGRAQIEQLYRDRFTKSEPALEARIESEQLMLDGGLAYERGRGALTRLENATRVTDWARFLTVWQRQSDGDWKIFRVVLPGQ